jgi:hypothetical protein
MRNYKVGDHVQVKLSVPPARPQEGTTTPSSHSTVEPSTASTRALLPGDLKWGRSVPKTGVEYDYLL